MFGSGPQYRRLAEIKHVPLVSVVDVVTGRWVAGAVRRIRGEVSGLASGTVARLESGNHERSLPAPGRVSLALGLDLPGAGSGLPAAQVMADGVAGPNIPNPFVLRMVT